MSSLSAARHATPLVEPRSDVAPTFVAIGRLRAAVTLMVLAHHAMMAYHPYAPAPGASLAVEPRAWLAFPVVDSARSTAFMVLIAFNDTFGMALMFFLSGLFVRRSLRRKGGGAFLRGRAIRLGLPFLMSALVLTPIAYFPAYLQTTTAASLGGFREAWSAMGTWPAAAGPAWFLWMLLAFDAVAAALFARAPWAEGVLARTFSDGSERVAACFRRLVLVSTVAYVPLALMLGPGHWETFGPFTFQASRPLLYLTYFFAGAAVGIHGIERGLLAPDGELARRRGVWVRGALLAFGIASASGLAAADPSSSVALRVVAASAFVVAAAASTFAVLAVFVRVVGPRGRFLDRLRDDAYGMFVLHFPIVSWLQYALVQAPLPAIVKGALVFVGTAASTWALSASLRRVPAIARVL